MRIEYFGYPMEIQYVIKDYNSLSTEELYAILQLRQAVFIVEQDCPYLDADGHDQPSHHVMGWREGQLHTYARLVPKGFSYPENISIGRVITSAATRGHGYGKALMKESIRAIKQLYPKEDIKISAQVYALPFYERLGFVESGEAYLEDNIPHKAMYLKC